MLNWFYSVKVNVCLPFLKHVIIWYRCFLSQICTSIFLNLHNTYCINKVECELNDKTCKPHTVWMFFSWLEVCDILNLKKKEPLSIHKTEIIPINLCSNSCFRGNMCTVIVKEDWKKKNHIANYAFNKDI